MALQIDQRRQRPWIELDFRQYGCRIDLPTHHGLAADVELDARLGEIPDHLDVRVVKAVVARLEGTFDTYYVRT